MKKPNHLPEETIQMLHHLVQNGLDERYVEKLLELCSHNCSMGNFPTDDPTSWIAEMIMENMDFFMLNVPEYYN